MPNPETDRTQDLCQCGNNAATGLIPYSQFLHVCGFIQCDSNSLFLAAPLSRLCGLPLPLPNPKCISQSFVLEPLFFPISSLFLRILTHPMDSITIYCTEDIHTWYLGNRHFLNFRITYSTACHISLLGSLPRN